MSLNHYDKNHPRFLARFFVLSVSRRSEAGVFAKYASSQQLFGSVGSIFNGTWKKDVKASIFVKRKGPLCLAFLEQSCQWIWRGDHAALQRSEELVV